MIGCIFTFVGFFGVLVYVPESPLWALKVGQTEKAKTIILRIMKENNVDCIEEIQNIDKLDTSKNSTQIGLNKSTFNTNQS